MKERLADERRPYRMQARAEAAQATLQRALDAAVRLFTDLPYDDVSLDEVARRAGVTKRTLLRRFGSKEDLFTSAMERDGLEEAHERARVPVGDVAAAVASVVASYERWGPNRLRLLAQEDRIPVVARDVEIGRRFHHDWVERTFAPLIAPLDGAARRRRVAALIALTDVYTWKLLRLDLGMEQAEVERTLVELITSLEDSP